MELCGLRQDMPQDPTITPKREEGRQANDSAANRVSATMIFGAQRINSLLERQSYRPAAFLLEHQPGHKESVLV